MFDLVLKGGLVVRPEGALVADLGITGGTIRAIEPAGGLTGGQVVDVSGKILFPGIVDAHMHIPGYFLSSRFDNFDTATSAAALGGVTTIMIQPTEDPRTVTPSYFERKKRLGEAQSHVDFCVQALVSQATEKDEIEGMADMGAVSFEVYLWYGGNPGFVIGNDDYELFRLLKLIREVDRVAGITPHSMTLIAKLTELQKECEQARRFREPERKRRKILPSGVKEFALTRPTLSEGLGITRACTVAAETGTRLHLRALSSRRSVDLVRRFQDAAPLSSEVMTHHLLFTDVEAERFGPYGKIVPPIRSAEERDFLRACVKDGRIDMVVSDHSPVLEDDKEGGWFDIWQTLPGMPGLQTFFTSMMALVDEGVLDHADVARRCSEQPARLFGLFPRKGALAVGADADVIVADPGRTVLIDNQSQKSRARYTTMRGRKVKTGIDSVYLRGRLLARDGKLEGGPAGRFVRP